MSMSFSGDNMNAFLNENWRDVIKEIGGAISESIKAVIQRISIAYIEKIPYKDFFLP